MLNFVIQCAPFAGRIDLPWFLNDEYLTGVGVEIGTHRGEYADHLLNRWHGDRLDCIDPWVGGYDPGDPASHGDREADYREATDRLGMWGDRCRIIRETSAAAVYRYENNSLDFVYIDGDHRFDAVWMDLLWWWPCVRPGGILAGHDIICPGEVGGGHGRNIQPAVLRFCNTVSADLWLITEPTCLPWSYYVRKPTATRE